MKKQKLFWSVVVIVGVLAVGVYYGITMLRATQEINKRLSEENVKLLSKSTLVELTYNKSTGELFATIPNNAEHTCVWTIWGDHGSEMKLTTDKAFISDETDPYIKSNKFLPPRVPIYVTCVDWENRSYYGTIGEYK